MKQAVEDIERTNTILFASSFSGKWGDYDPSPLKQDNHPDHPDHSSPPNSK